MSNDQPIKIELTVAQVNTVLGSLAKQPLEVVLDTFNTIQQQATGQIKAADLPR